MDWVAIYIVLICGAILQNTIGFGLGLLSAPILIHLAPQMVPVPMILNALLVTLIIAWHYLEYVDRRRVSFAILGGTLGVILASLLTAHIEPSLYRVIFGCLIIAGVLLSVVGLQPQVNPATNTFVGMLSGFMGTLTSAGGAPIGLLYQGEKSNEIKANLSIFFIYINSVGVLGLSLAGFATETDVINFIKAAPAVVIGWWLSKYVNSKISNDIIKSLILGVAFLSGLAAIIL